MQYPSHFTAPMLLTMALTTVIATVDLFSGRPAHAQQNYAIPAVGTVRVIAHKLHNDPEKVEWQWSVITDRRWSGTETNSQGQFELHGGDTSARLEKGNVYDLYILVRSDKDSEGKPHLYTVSRSQHRPIRIHGSNWTLTDGGRMSSGGGSEPLLKTVAANKAAKVLFTEDKILTLPVKAPLYERTYGLDGTGKVKRQIYYLIIGKDTKQKASQ